MVGTAHTQCRRLTTAENAPSRDSDLTTFLTIHGFLISSVAALVSL